MLNQPPSSFLSRFSEGRLRESLQRRLLDWIDEITQAYRGTLPISLYGKGDGDGYQFLFDEPSGERFEIHVRSNGSVQSEVRVDLEESLPVEFQANLIQQMAELISNLYHDDILAFSHAVIDTESGFLIRSIASIQSLDELPKLLAESLTLLDLIVDRVALTMHDLHAHRGEGSGDFGE